MRRSRITAYVLAIAFIAGTAALAPSGPSFDLSWHTIDGGGGTSTGGGFELTGTVGQPDTGVVMTGGSFALIGGFWAGPAPIPCPEDTNGDGAINVLDLIEVLLCFGQPAIPPCDTGQDTNNDGAINVLDLIDVLLQFGQACP